MIKYSIHSEQKEIAIKGKTYIGTGRYKDENDYVWDLERDGSDWVIRRIGRKRERKVETAEEYWNKILTDEMIKVVFDGNVTEIKGKPDKKSVLVKIETKDKNSSILKIKNNKVLVISSSDKNLIGKEVFISNVPKMMDISSFYMKMAATEEFKNFVVLNLLGG